VTLITELETVLKLHILLQIIIKYELFATFHSGCLCFKMSRVITSATGNLST